jgi:hypothetical protein
MTSCHLLFAEGDVADPNDTDCPWDKGGRERRNRGRDRDERDDWRRRSDRDRDDDDRCS